jgi:hypothetical protein
MATNRSIARQWTRSYGSFLFLEHQQSEMHRILILVTPLMLVAGGCNPTSHQMPPETDPVKGRAALRTVLDTWINGGNPNDLKAIVAYDPDWEEGHRLIKYEIDPANGRAGVDLLLIVTLTLTRADGKTQEKTVNFSVAIGAQTVVTRKQ